MQKPTIFIAELTLRDAKLLQEWWADNDFKHVYSYRCYNDKASRKHQRYHLYRKPNSQEI